MLCYILRMYEWLHGSAGSESGCQTNNEAMELWFGMEDSCKEKAQHVILQKEQKFKWETGHIINLVREREMGRRANDNVTVQRLGWSSFFQEDRTAFCEAPFMKLQSPIFWL